MWISKSVFEKSLRFLACLAVIMCSLLMSTPAQAADYDVILEVYQREDANKRLTPHGESIMGDHVDRHTGALTFQHTDVSLPGNFGLDVGIGRKLTSGGRFFENSNEEFGDWVLDIPRIYVLGSIDGSGNTDFKGPRCSQPENVFHSELSVTTNFYNFDQAHEDLANAVQHYYSASNGLDQVNAWTNVFEIQSRVEAMEIAARRRMEPQKIPADSDTNAYSGDTASIWPVEYSNGLIMDIPRIGKQQVLRHLEGSGAVSPFPSSAKYGTSGGWYITCGSASDGGEGFVAMAPNGTQYKFSEFKWSRGNPMRYRPFGPGNIKLERSLNTLLVSEVTDKVGNKVNYNYDGAGRLINITSSDGRQISVSYKNGTDLIETVTANGRIWRYHYIVLSGKSFLSRVIQPDDLVWEFSLSGMAARPVQGPKSCTLPAETLTMVHPNGANAIYNLKHTNHRYGWDMWETHMTEVCNGFIGPNQQFDYYDLYQGIQKTMSVVKKTIQAPNTPDSIWEFTYEEDIENERYPVGHVFEGHPIASSTDDRTNWTEVIRPDGTEAIYYHFWTDERFGGQVDRLEIYSGPGGSLLEKQSNEYIVTLAYGKSYIPDYYAYGGFNFSPPSQICDAGCKMVSRSQTTIERDGDSFTTEFEYNNDQAAVDYSYGHPTITKVYGDVGGASTVRDIVTNYEHNTANWIIGLPEQVTVNGRDTATYSYNGLGQKTSQKRYGEPFGSFTYDDDGTPLTITDPLLNTATYTNWKRGIVQNIERPDGETESQVVDDNGWVTSSTTARGFTTSYLHDDMGRVEKIIPPKETQDWYDTDISYSFGDDIVQTITKGSAQTSVTYDSRFRPILEKVEDTSTGWESYVKTSYDALGRVRFKSQPSSSPDPSQGTDFTYDGLGRPLTEDETVTTGIIEKTYEYLPSNATSVTDAEGNTTTTYKNGFNEVTLIVQPEDTTTTITRNGWGQMTRVRQQGDHNGIAVNKFQDYGYDDQQRLCRHYVPSGGGYSLYAYDASGNLSASSKGHAWGTTCDTGPNNENDNLISYSYDPMNRLTFTNYADDGTPDTARAYDADGNLQVLYREDGSEAEIPWYDDPKFTQWIYYYDELGNVIGEVLHIDWRQFTAAHDYNRDGSLATSSRQYRHAFWPETHEGFRHEITYDRDGLGRGTGVSLSGDGTAGTTSLAHSAAYYPSGTLQALSYGNGIDFTQQLNSRLMPEKLRAVGGGVTALDLEYFYNPRGLVSDMNDHTNPANDRDYLYDGQGRLTDASGSWGAGTFKYDSLGNIREKKLGGRTITLLYNGSNQVSWSTDTGGSAATGGNTGSRSFDYDDWGNAIKVGGLNMEYDASDRPTGLSGDANGTYRYDGHGRRVKSITKDSNNKNVTRYNVYDISGSLAYVAQLAPGFTDDYVTNYVKMDGQSIARVKSVGTRLNYVDELTYLHHDHLGSAVSGTDEDGNIAFTERYTPYGITLDNDAANDNQAGFTGHIKDTDTGLNYMQARYYNPVIGRFLSHDPMTMMDMELDPGYFNRYMYTMNNPVNATDPNGEQVLVEAQARPLGETSSAGSVDEGQDTNGLYGHGSVKISDYNSSQESITSAFPTAGTDGGAFAKAGVSLEAINVPVSQSPDASSQTYDVEVLPITYAEATTIVDNLVQATNSANIPYAGTSIGGQNSNNYHGEAFNALTGRNPVNQSGMALPGTSERLPELHPAPQANVSCAPCSGR